MNTARTLIIEMGGEERAVTLSRPRDIHEMRTLAEKAATGIANGRRKADPMRTPFTGRLARAAVVTMSGGVARATFSV